LSEAEAQKKRKSDTLQSAARASHVQGYSALPVGLRDLIAESYALHDRIVRLDRAISIKLDDVATEPVLSNPVGSQIDRLRVAFGR
jgi:regulator of CtrA degradation